MINYLNNLVNNSDYIVFIFVAFLIIISMMMVYLVYSQNKQLTKELMERDKKQINPIPENNDLIDLKQITKELASAPKEKTIDLTSYEEEQEEKAIISYEELLNANQNVSISYSETQNEDDIVVKKIDLENTGKIELDPIKKELNTKIDLITYEHEEAFLEALKQLQKLLN